MLWIFSPKTSKTSLFTWPKQCHKGPITTSLIPLSLMPLAFWPKLESLSFFFLSRLLAKPRDPAFQNEATAHHRKLTNYRRNHYKLWFACFLHYSYFLVSLKVWKWNSINHSFMCFFSKTGLTHGNKLLSKQLEHLQTTAHCREDEEIKREVEGQKPYLKKTKHRVSSRFSRVDRVMGWPGHGLTRRVARVLPGCCICRSFNKTKPV